MSNITDAVTLSHDLRLTIILCLLGDFIDEGVLSYHISYPVYGNG